MQAVEWLPSDPTEAKKAVARFEGYAKLQGILQAQGLGLPTLPGLVVDPRQVKDVDFVISEARKLHPRSVLVRHDKSPETGDYPQGGYIVRIENLETELNWYRSQDRILILLYPADPLDNLYSAAAAITADYVVELEIVGPGFDASDLNRGFLSPLESHRYILDPNDTSARKISSAYVDEMTYLSAKRLRIQKIALKYVQHRRFINAESISFEDARNLVQAANLPSRPQIEALFEQTSYKPAPPRFLKMVIESAQSIVTELMVRRKDSEKLVAFSGSQIENSDKFVIWDIVTPRRKYSFA